MENKPKKVENSQNNHSTKDSFLDPLCSFIQNSCLYIEQFKNVRNQRFFQRMMVCDLLKNDGNFNFKSGNFKKASELYEQSLSIIRYIINLTQNQNQTAKNERILIKIKENSHYIDFIGETKNESKVLNSTKLILHLNLAASYLKEEDYKNTLKACEIALKFDPCNIKALFRSAKAKISKQQPDIQDYRSAINDLKLAYKIDPNDISIRNEITRITDEYLKMCNKNINISKSVSVVDQLIEDEEKFPKKKEKCEKIRNMETFISTITEKKKSKKSTKKEKNQKEQENNSKILSKELDPTNKQDLINEEEQEWSDLEEEKDEFDINESDFELTYEINPNAIIPDEIKELGSFLEKKGGEILKNYEKQGKKDKADKLRKKLSNALMAKTQLEKIAKLDFEKPTDHLKKLANKFGIDVSDPSIKDELIKIQSQNLRDIRTWLKKIKSSDKLENDFETITGDSSESDSQVKNPKKIKKKSKKDVNKGNISSNTSFVTNNHTNIIQQNGNNFYINNNFYNPSTSINTNEKYFNNYQQKPEGNPSNSTSINSMNANISNQTKSHEKNFCNEKEISDVILNLNNLNTESNSENKMAGMMNLLIILLAILITFIILFWHHSGNKQKTEEF